MKSGVESGGPLGGGFIEHHDLCFFMVDAQTQAFSVDGRVGSSKVDETAVTGETILASLLYGGNKRVDGVVGLAGNS